ncbi:serine/threonine-protein kinase [Polyangium sp. y55x31]|uniref:serine/threonine-protein kinase n=1 Tax=Polyangium sp. y55x31 TaxID=3042688 RepID=UPI002482554F|nr:serine/threonine-protein kinase [Polyangium sp. y55x31]MDI1476818.1 protein kinase [Polyangium sp. y55x31]
MRQILIAPGDVLLDKYRVERVLGQGGMGFVVAARHTGLDELFAIKLMLPGALSSEDAGRRFLREARAAVRLKGEHAVRVHDVGRLADGSLYMVMEHLSGKDLKTHLAENGPLPAAEAVSYMLQACEGIAEAHDRGIIHRDIKPANLFLTKRRNGTPCIKILDFGISKQAAGERSGDITKTGTMLGSPLYMSPEQMAHAREVDKRTDIWSLGVVLYELLTGKPPFDAESFTQIVYRVTNLDPTPLCEVRPELPKELGDVVMRCLGKDPEGRFESVDALAAALEPFGSAPPSSVPARMDEPSDATSESEETALSSSNDGREKTRAGNNRFVIGAALAVAAGMTALLLFTRGGDEHTTPPAPTTAAESNPGTEPVAPAPREPETPAPKDPPAPVSAQAAVLASAPSPPKPVKSGGSLRPAKPTVEAAPPVVGASPPAPAPSSAPTPQSSVSPRKHSLF